MAGPLNFPGMMMAAGVDTGIAIANSCKFNDNAFANMTRVPGTPTDGDVATVSLWVKRANMGAIFPMFGAGVAANYTDFYFSAADQLLLIFANASVATGQVRTTAVFRDPSAWYHIVVRWDVNASAGTEVQMYVNGIEHTLTYIDPVDPQANKWNSSSYTNYVGRFGNAVTYFDGYLAEVHSIDGQLKLPTDFAKLNNEGHWVPIPYAGTYGAEGFHLDFKVASGTGDGAGTDVSGNANHFIDSGLVASDQRIDTPTDNYCTLNPLCVADDAVYSNGNLQINFPGSGSLTQVVSSTWAMERGKWFWEVDILVGIAANNMGIGVQEVGRVGGLESHRAAASRSYAYDSAAGNYYDLGSAGGYGATWQLGDTISIALDMDIGAIWFAKNGTWQNGATQAEIEAGTTTNAADAALPSLPLTPIIGDNQGLLAADHVANFGHVAFTATKPTGFNTLNTANLDANLDAPIPKGSDYFDVLIYTGNGTAIGSGGNAIAGLDFSPDLVWIKDRTTARNSNVTDTSRGATNYLVTSREDVEATNAEALNTFDAGGFTVGNLAEVNTNTENFVGWCWKKAAIAGFDIALHTGTGVAKTVAHSLGAVPDIIISKDRDTQLGSDDWQVYASNMLDSASVPLADPETDSLRLNEWNFLIDDNTIWDDTAPDANNFTVGTHASVNENTRDSVVYLFRDVPGFFRTGSYVGNGSVNGTFVWCGFRPRLLIIKRTDGGTVSWFMLDPARADVAGANPIDQMLWADIFNSETTGFTMDFLANGFKPRLSSQFNAGSQEFMFMAWAEHPFKYARAF